VCACTIGQQAAEAHILKVKVLVVGAVLVRERVRLVHADCRGRSKLLPMQQHWGALACAGYQEPMIEALAECKPSTGQNTLASFRSGARCRACTLVDSTCRHTAVCSWACSTQGALRVAHSRPGSQRRGTTAHSPRRTAPRAQQVLQAPRTRPLIPADAAPQGRARTVLGQLAVGLQAARLVRHVPVSNTQARWHTRETS